MGKVPSFDEINNKLLFDKLDPEIHEQKKKLECIQIIAKRFIEEHKIKILEHVRFITKVGYTYEQGFEYKVLDKNRWVQALYDSKKFLPDLKDNFIGYAASFFTDGKGFREIGSNKSLHCAVDDHKCSVHLDNTGFRIKGPNGTYYSLDALQHVIYDLVWDDMVVKNLYKLHYRAGWFFDRIQPVFLNSKNNYSRYGVKALIIDSKTIQLNVEYMRSFDIGKSIQRGNDFYKEFAHPKEQKFWVNLEMTFDETKLFR